MKRLMYIALIALSTSATLAERSNAQVGDAIREIAAIRLELERTDYLLEKVGDISRTNENPVVADLYQKAKDIQTDAWRNFHLRTETGYRLARELTLQARNLAKSALTNGRRSENAEGVVLARMERVQELLDRAREEMGVQDVEPEMKSLLESASERLARGWELYRDAKYRPALKLAEQAENAAERLLKNANESSRDRNQAERLGDKIRATIDQARSSVANCNSERARQLVMEADAAFRQAHDLRGQGRPRLSLRELQRSRDLALNAMKECDGQDNLQLRYERLKTSLELLSEKASDNSGPNAQVIRDKIAQCTEQLDRARQALSKSDFDTASIALRVAQLALQQAQELLSADSSR